MFDKSRLMAAVVYFGAMVMTLVVALKLRSTLLSLVFVIVQLLAAVWYGASFIPFARNLIGGVVGAVISV